MKLILAILFLLPGLAAAFPATAPCDPQEKEIIREVLRKAETTSAGLLKRIDRAIGREKEWNTWRKLLVSRTVLACARGLLRNLTYVCTAGDEDFSGRTYPVISKKVYLSPSFFEDRSAGLLIHEATHHCGTNDTAYFSAKRPPRDTGLGWQTVASTYHYWIMHGFCIPGRTCR